MSEKTLNNAHKNETHVLAIVKSDNVRKQLLNILDAFPEITCKAVVGDRDIAQSHISADRHGSVIMLEIGRRDQNVIEFMQACKEAYSIQEQQPFIIISDGLDDKIMVKLLRMGVGDFLSLPLIPDETLESIARVAHRQKASTPHSPVNSEIITFVHASGGMGATTLAVNAATIINATSNAKHHQSACLLDLDLQYGGASVHLDLPGYSPVIDMLNRPERLDREMLEGMMMRHSSGLRVLTTPEAPLPVEAINSDIVNRLLQIAQSRYSYIVVDMSHTMTLWTDTVLKKSKVIYAVMQLNVPSIRQMSRWFSVLEHEGLRGLPIKVVVNRHIAFGRLRHDNIGIAQASEALGHKIDYLIPNDYELISQSLDQGMPAASIGPHSKFTGQLKTMLHEVVDEIELPKKSFWDRHS